MTKTSIAVVLLVLCSITAARADQNSNLVVTNAFNDLRREQNEDRTAINALIKKTRELETKVASNQGSTTTPAAAGAIDYTRYDLAVKDCAGSTRWVPTPATKEKDAIGFNNQSAEGFKLFRSECLKSQDAEGFAADARRAEKRERRLALAAPVAPAPEVIQENERPDATTADYREEDEQAVVQRAGYYPGSQAMYGRRFGARIACPSGFRFDPRERSCTRHTDVVGPSPYNETVQYCVPGSVRRKVVPGPNGGRRVVDQVCNRH